MGTRTTSKSIYFNDYLIPSSNSKIIKRKSNLSIINFLSASILTHMFL